MGQPNAALGLVAVLPARPGGDEDVDVALTQERNVIQAKRPGGLSWRNRKSHDSAILRQKASSPQGSAGSR